MTAEHTVKGELLKAEPSAALSPAKPKAFSYVRFSTPEQLKGDSFERQTKKAAEYAAAHGLELDTAFTLHDLGVSAFRGKNAATGALRQFLNAVELGDIPEGSFLLVESLDRVSRDQVVAAQGLFLQIIGAGVTLVTLIDRKSYSKESVNANPTDLILAILSMIRANEESQTKSTRVALAYERKRQRAAAGDKSKPFSRMLPAWLCWDEEHQQHKIIEERGAVVRNIFEKALAGWGQHKIAHWLNDQVIPTWGVARRAAYWHRSYVQKILTNPAVIGTFVPHHKRPDANGKRQRKALDAIPNHYPAVVDRETFDSVASRFSTPAPRGRHANQGIRSLFSGVLRCSQCGATVSRACKGEHVYLICARVNSLGVAAGPHPHQPVRYERVESLFRQRARSIVNDAPRTNDTDLEDRIQQCGVDIDAGEDIVRELIEELLEHRNSPAIRQRLQEAEAELENERDELRALIARRDALEPQRVERKLQALLAALKHKPFDVAAANNAMRQAVRKIVLNAAPPRALGDGWEGGSTLEIHWQHTAEEAEPQVLPLTIWPKHPTQKRRKRKAP
jgi:DNA invertase Pin-like site-specific DNA recombinase